MIRSLTCRASLLLGSLVLLLCALAPSAAEAQCAGWRPVPELAFADIVKAETLWDPDGDGPLPPRLVIAGRFAVAGWPNGVNAASIAMFDGSSWQPLGSGLVGNPDYATVTALTVYNGDLIAGGTFTTAGGNPITGVARWDGSAWHALGFGLSGGGAGTLTDVTSLAVYNGKLIVGGNFTAAGGLIVDNIAAWDGTSWSSLGGAADGGVLALAVYNGQLIAGGSFTEAGTNGVGWRIAAWNGASWSSLNGGIGYTDTVTGFDSEVESLAVYNNELIVGGRFTTVGNGGTPASDIAAWNGSSWRALGAGLTDSFNTQTSSLFYRGVHGLTTYNNRLIATGRFTGSAGGASAVNIASWDGSSWSPLGAGAGSYPSYFADEGVYSAQAFGGQLYIGGAFFNNGASAAFSFAQWTGSAWTSTPGVLANTSAGSVFALAPSGGGMLVSGDFGHVTLPGSLPFDFVKWNGLTVAPASIQPDAPVRTVVGFTRTPPISSDTYYAGDFTHIGTTAVGRIVSFNSLVAGMETFAGGVNGTVRAVEKFGGSIYAAGDFTANAAGSTALSHIARWNGSAWVPVGAGLNGAVNTLKSYNGFLYAGGAFTASGSTHTDAFAKWDGTSWSAVGVFFQGTVYATTIFQNQLVIAGDISGTIWSHGLIYTDGTTFSSYGVGDTTGPIRAMTVSNGTLVVGGDFTSVFGTPARHLARWDGSAWSEIGGGIDSGTVYALATVNGELHVGGSFRTVNSGEVGSLGYARFLETGLPWFALQPRSTTATCVDSPVSLTAQAAAGYNVSYSWRKNGTPLSDGPAPGGSVISGSATPTLTITGTTVADQGSYDCVASTVSCGSATSVPATLSVCYANCDCSTAQPMLNVLDFTCFLQKFAAGDPYANCDSSTQAPTLNVLDFTCFLQRFAAGCP